MTELDRRGFLKTSAGVAAGTAVIGGPFQGFVATAAQGRVGSGRGLDYGPLFPVRDKRDGAERLALPRGFQYRSFNPAGSELTDGTVTPGNHDGMAAFPGPRGNTILVRNHEINGPVGAFGETSTAYDEMAGGGTVNLVVSPHGHVHESYVSLNGSQMNCSGGPMPWGSWITCEETVNGPDVGNDFTGQDNSLLQAKHGYIFDVPSRGGDDTPTPVRNAGRFAHEAAVFDPTGVDPRSGAKTGIVYLTEDNFGFASGFYRYVPPANPMASGRLRDGGYLQMLKVTGMPLADLAGQDGPPPAPGDTFPIEWVDIDDPDPTFTGTPTNDFAIQAVGKQGFDQGAARFSRLEGAVYDAGVVFFASTQGGTPTPAGTDPSGYGKGRGQIWAYDTKTEVLKLIFESPSRDVLDFPDNVTNSRNGTLVLCEDGNQGNFLRGLTPEGDIFTFAQNLIPGVSGGQPTLGDDEFAGSTFSPDFRTLFVNIQSSANGMTFAIWGPWASGGFA